MCEFCLIKFRLVTKLALRSIRSVFKCRLRSSRASPLLIRHTSLFAHYLQLWKKYDKDCSGFIESDELRVGFYSLRLRLSCYEFRISRKFCSYI